MYSNFITYQVIAQQLHSILKDAWCTDCFSTGKDELVMQFRTADKKQFQLLAKFIDGELIYRFFSPEVSFTRKSLRQMKEVEGQQVVSVRSTPLERIFSIAFANGYALLFKGFGRLGNILLYHKNQILPVQIFRNNIAADLQFDASQTRNWPIEDADFMANTKSPEALGFLPAELQKQLQQNGFETQDPEEKISRLWHIISLCATGNFYADTAKNPIGFSLLPGDGKELLGEGLEALDTFAEKYIYQKLFLQEKQRLLSRINKDIKHYKRLLADNLQRRENIATRRSYRELGDIVMTYAHSIKPGVSNAFLTDYYTGNPIRVKLDPNMGAAENAERYYRKAKNEVLELQNTEKNIAESENKLKQLEAQLLTVNTAVSFKGLKENKTERQPEQQQKYKPYKEEVFQDFTIWIGKNAKSNDEMLKLAGKNDLWLHAKGVAGSHVIIKKQGAHFPEPVVQYAAKLAAANSKAKTQAVVPVICVERKFVSKGKNAAPGEVRVMKEQIVDAFLD